MTVKELIQKLNAMPQDMEVVVNLNVNEMANGKTATVVEVEEVTKHKWQSDGMWIKNYFPENDLDEDEELKSVVNISA
jgi:ribosome maturation protein Sdo1